MGGQQPNARVYEPYPKTPEGKIDKDRVKELYMASEHLTWTSFARDHGWNPRGQDVPHQRWKREKKKGLASRQSEELKDLLFDHKGRWHQDVLKTLKNYPAANDALMSVLSQAIRELQILTQQAQKLKAEDIADKGLLAQVKVSDLVGLSVAVKSLTESKYRSLLLTDWSVKLAEDASTPEGAQKQVEVSASPSSTWNIKLIGKEMDVREFEGMVNSLYDPPNKVAAEDPGV